MIDAIPARDLDEAVERARPALAALHGASIFVTGGTGFFGTWLVALLTHARRRLDIDVDITLLSRDPEAFATAWPQLAASVRVTRGDIRFFEFPKGRFTHIVHAATDTSAAADRDAATLVETIVDGTKRVLEFAGAVGVTRLLYVSSGAIYGAQPSDMDRIPEDYRGACDPLDSRSAYGQAKRLAEQLCVCAAGGVLAPVIARGFAFVGPGLPLDAHFAIGNFIRDASRGQGVTVAGDGRPLRSYLYAGDLAAWLITLLVRGERCTAYNVGSDQAISITDLARKVAALGLPRCDVMIAGKPASDVARARYVPAIDKARALGLEVWTDLDEAIRRTSAYARNAAGPGPAAHPHQNEHARAGTKTFVIDVDGVVASLVPDNDYAKAEPLDGTIEAINRLHARGHRIVMFTARGSATGLDWEAVTRAQFQRWGLHFHELRFGKPAGDYYVDDRLLSVGALAAMARVEV